MAGVITVRKKNEVHLVVRSEDQGIEREISEFFTFMVDGAKYQSKYKAGLWDGLCRMYNLRSHTLYCGLFEHLNEFARTRDYSIQIDPDPIYGSPGDVASVKPEDLFEYAKSLNLTAHGDPIEPKDYQLAGVHHALTNRRCVLISPTSSGKSLMIYLMSRWMLERERVRKILIVVTNVGLTQQLFGDFEDYSSRNCWSVSEVCHKIFAGQEKEVESALITISTWQSLAKLGPLFFQKYDCIIGDEAHTFKAKSLCGIMENLTQARYRIGTTGTIPENSQVNKLTLAGVFGPIHRVTTTKALMDEGTVAEMRIDVVLLKYSEDECKITKNLTYQQEIDFLVQHEGRNRFIRNLAIAQEKNTLVLFNLVQKHGRVLFDMICSRLKETDPTRKVFFISGATDAEDREAVRKIAETEKNAIIVASVGTFSTGVNIRNLHSCVFAAPTKSQIRTLQSIGRILRKHGDDKKARVFDLADDLHWKKRRNFTLNHSAERIKYYAAEKFDYRITEVKM